MKQAPFTVLLHTRPFSYGPRRFFCGNPFQPMTDVSNLTVHTAGSHLREGEVQRVPVSPHRRFRASVQCMVCTWCGLSLRHVHLPTENACNSMVNFNVIGFACLFVIHFNFFTFICRKNIDAYNDKELLLTLIAWWITT